ncbi:MAG: response regulator [Desulfobacter sp.]|nr:MAG: response regulator [Desulfobacter sp.]
MSVLPNKLRVLVVDDSISMRRIIRGFLERNGVTRIAEAGNGQAALELIRFQALDLIISDLNMPVMNGMELLETLNGDQEFRAIPFVILTVEANQKTMNLALETGADSYIVKPVSEAPFIKEIQRVLTGSGRM